MGNNERSRMGVKIQFTLKKLAEIAFNGVEIPDCFRPIADSLITDMTQEAFCNDTEHKKGVRVLFITVFEIPQMAQYAEHIKNGVVVISGFNVVNENGTVMDIIKLPNAESVRTAWRAVGQYIKREVRIPTIGITGSIGKTTTTRFMQNLFEANHKVFVSGGNLNSADYIVRQMFRGYDASYEYHVQEVGGGLKGSVEKTAKMLDVDAFCISNIYPHHIDKYKTVENILYDKSSFDRVGDKRIFGVINIDDDMLRSHPFNNRIVTCGIVHTEADYVAKNIVSDNTALEFDVVFGGESVHILIQIPGRHNVYNALLAFAMAKEFGLSNEEIQQGFLNYTSDVIRQTIKRVAGRTLYIDCFNCCADAIRSDLSTLESLKPAAQGRRIAVLGGENSLGERLHCVNYSVGTELARYNVDEFLFVGVGKDAAQKDLDWYGDSYSLYEGAESVIRDRPVSYYDNLKAAASRLREISRPGDVILFKGLYRLCFLAIIDMAFGTSYTNNNPYYAGRKLCDNGYMANYYKEFDGCSIMAAPIGPSVVIPKTIAGKPVFRIGKGIFKGCKIKNVEFGCSVSNIGEECFSGCGLLTSLVIPSNIIYIEANAFSDCTRLKRVEICHAAHIGKGAFSGCTKLKTVKLTSRCIELEEDVFKGCKNVLIQAPEGSYAYEYAVKNHLRVEAR